MTTKVGSQYGTNQSASSSIVDGVEINESFASLAPALGESWAHACTVRVSLGWSGNTRVAKLLKSPSSKMSAALFTITHEGVKDVNQLRNTKQSNGASSPIPHVTHSASSNSSNSTAHSATAVPIPTPHSASNNTSIPPTGPSAYNMTGLKRKVQP